MKRCSTLETMKCKFKLQWDKISYPSWRLKSGNITCWWGCGKSMNFILLKEDSIVSITTLQHNLSLRTKIENVYTQDPRIPLLEIHVHMHQEKYPKMYIAALFIISPNSEQPKCLSINSIDKWIMCYYNEFLCPSQI